MRRVADELDIRRRTLTDQRGQLTQAYQRQYDAVTVKSLALVALGIALFGSLAAWFFARLRRDVQRLGEHARQIVQGTRGVAMAVRREDELGQLMHAVNRMALDLDEREKQIELEGQRRSHQDKMLAVGALAAGVAHEVNNPLAVITGVAQALKDAPGVVPPGELAHSAQLIMMQAQRAAHAARQLADVAAPQPAELDLVELNSLVRRVVQLLGYDRRYRSIVFELDTDSALPAVRSSAMAVQQVLMQVLSMGCDAMVGQGGSAALVQVATRRVDTGVEIELGFPPVLDFTRSEVQRSLLLARATIEPLGGRLAFPRKEGSLLQIRLVLPAGTGTPTEGA